MPRTARIVIPGIPHHITQRGNRQMEIFFTDADRAFYKKLLREACERHQVSCAGWCFMTNHIHLILIPPASDSLRAVLSSVHTSYTQRLNLRLGLSGHLFQGRYASYPMDEAHFMAALRYVENNPVKAELVAQAEDWEWSSARAHIRQSDDGLTSQTYLQRHYPNWRAMLSKGWESGADANEDIELALQSGMPRGSDDWRAQLVSQFGLAVRGTQRGRPPKKGTVPFS
jgi:putative transposase